MMDPRFIGTFAVIFVQGFGSRVLDFVSVTVDDLGRPIFLQTEDGAMYNWESIITMKRTED